MTADPARWRGDETDIESRLHRRLTAAEADALARSAEHWAPDPETPAEKALSARGGWATAADRAILASLASLAAELRHAVTHGSGALILTGLDLASLPPDGYARIFRILGGVLGRASIQSPAAERIARVERSDDNPEGRGTLTDAELRPHTDLHEILALACVREAAEGGESMLVSAAALRDAVRRRSPQALASLERGYPHGINPAVGGAEPVTRQPVPIFSTAAGKLSCCYNRFFIESAARLRGEPLPADLTAAMVILDEEAARPGLGFRFRLRPGEMVFWHDWTCLHARTAFRDRGTRRRRLLRLWLNAHDPRPVDPRVAARAPTIDADHRAAAVRRSAAA